MNDNTTKPSRFPGTRPAATTILAREGAAGSGFKVFLMRRHRKQSFMANAYVFPGGKVDAADAADELALCAGGFSGDEALARLCDPSLTAADARGFYFCALRELFEEAGVLLARDKFGIEVDFRDPAMASRFERYRHQVHEGEVSLLELARAESLVYRAGDLALYSHWITPAIEKKRFDTRFFLARLPDGQEPTHDEVELVDSIWISPEKALAEQHEGRLMLMPPTLKTMEELVEFGSLDDLFAAVRAREVLPILPQGFKTDTGFGVLLPHDPDYNLAGLKQPPRPGETSRLVLQDGQWHSCAKA